MFANYVTLVGPPFVRIEGPPVVELLIILLLKYFKDQIMMILLIFGVWVCLLMNFLSERLLSITADERKPKGAF